MLQNSGTSSANWLKKAVLSAALKSSTVLKFLSIPGAWMELGGSLLPYGFHRIRGTKGRGCVLERVVIERVPANCEIATKRDLFASLSILYRFPKGVGCIDRHRVVR